MKELTIHDIEAIISRDESRVLEVKKTTGELYVGMQSGCAFLNTEGGWLFFGIHPTTLKILGQDVVDKTRQEVAHEMTKFSPAIDLYAQYIDVPERPGPVRQQERAHCPAQGRQGSGSQPADSQNLVV